MRRNVLYLLGLGGLLFASQNNIPFINEDSLIPSHVGRGSGSGGRKKKVSPYHDKKRKRYHHIRNKSRRINRRKRRHLKKF